MLAKTSDRTRRRRVWALFTQLTGLIGLFAVSMVPAVQAPALAVRAQASLAAYPVGPKIKLTEVASAAQPIGVYGRPGDESTLYIVEKAGRIRTVRAGSWGPTLIDLRSIVSTQNERGLFAMVFTEKADRVFVTYAAVDGAFTLSEFGVNGETADPTSERVLLRIAHPNDDHYGGAIVRTAGGLLLIGVGDGGGVGTRGGVGDKANNAQNLNVLLGKVLRINPTPANGGAYGIPAENPFAKGTVDTPTGARKARPEIWAYGLRNPWRMTLDANDGLWIADVGQSNWEEVNRVSVNAAGVNYGWRQREGTKAYRGGRKPTGATDPVFEFAHDKGRCAVIGGAVADPRVAVPGLEGKFIFGEVCSGRLAAFDPARPMQSAADLGDRTPYLTFVGNGPDGRTYVTSLNGRVYRVDAG